MAHFINGCQVDLVRDGVGRSTFILPSKMIAKLKSRDFTRRAVIIELTGSPLNLRMTVRRLKHGKIKGYLDNKANRRCSACTRWETDSARIILTTKSTAARLIAPQRTIIVPFMVIMIAVTFGEERLYEAGNAILPARIGENHC